MTGVQKMSDYNHEDNPPNGHEDFHAEDSCVDGAIAAATLPPVSPGEGPPLTDIVDNKPVGNEQAKRNSSWLSHYLHQADSKADPRQETAAKGSAPPDSNKDRNSDHENKNTGGAQTHDEEWNDDFAMPKPKKLLQGLDGLAVTAFGVAVPAIMLILTCMSMPKRLTLVLLNHPLETIAELLLIIAIPIANFIAWRALCANKVRFSQIPFVLAGQRHGHIRNSCSNFGCRNLCRFQELEHI
jgi:hypothetical protein